MGAFFKKTLVYQFLFYGENRNLVFEAVPGSKVSSLLLIIFLLFVIAGVYLIKKRSLQDKKLSNLAFITGVFVFPPMFWGRVKTKRAKTNIFNQDKN